MNKVYLAGGCFWCISDYFLMQKGIKNVIVGYSGGNEKDINYKLVKAQKTKHRETIEVTYDETLSIEQILDIYFSYIDKNDQFGQFGDIGFSYTLAIYYENNSDYLKIKKYLDKIDSPCYVSLEKFKFFIKAEEYHQNYSSKNPDEFLEELKNSKRTCHLLLKEKKTD